MLVLADRNFYSYQAWQQAAATGAALLWRVSGRLALPILRALPDGSYRSLLINPKIRGRRREMLLAAAAAGEHLEPPQAIFVRVIEYLIEDRPGSGELFCLITTITDQQLAPPRDLATVYHQRWEIELSFDEIETHQTGHLRVLRSRTPELVKQVIWALLLTHYAIRHLMKDAGDTVGTDPDDLSFIRSYRPSAARSPTRRGLCAAQRLRDAAPGVRRPWTPTSGRVTTAGLAAAGRSSKGDATTRLTIMPWRPSTPTTQLRGDDLPNHELRQRDIERRLRAGGVPRGHASDLRSLCCRRGPPAKHCFAAEGRRPRRRGSMPPVRVPDAAHPVCSSSPNQATNGAVPFFAFAVASQPACSGRHDNDCKLPRS
jgi:hypothetical protein